jgi:hypothetical protein
MKGDFMEKQNGIGEPKKRKIPAWFTLLSTIVAIVLVIVVIVLGITAKRDDAASRSLCSHPVEVVLHEGSNTSGDREQISLKYFPEGECANLASMYCNSDLGAYGTYSCSVLTKEQEEAVCALFRGKSVVPLPPFCQ